MVARPPVNHRKIVKERRDYNAWVANETIEDYSLRYAPQSFRKWSEFLVANTALGGISFLALEAIGGSLIINYGFANSFWAILAVSAIIFLTGIPIAYYAAKYNIDIDLLTRGAGFGYIGSTITSLIYASFTFIFFALEAAIMAQALQLYFHLPLAIGYIVSSLVIIPLVFYGVTLINQLQLWTQPIWLSLMILPYIFVLYKEPDAFSNWLNFAGNSPSKAAFDPLLFGTAATVSFSLIAQIGEQVDYLRFLPDRQENNRGRWWLAVILAGPGWIILGAAKQLGGAFLASLAISHGLPPYIAKEPIHMYMTGFADIFSRPEVVLFVATLFVVISQIKINVTNAYGGSLAWSNFFSRLTHSHPGRVVWLIFNVAIALLLMELGVFDTLEAILGLYSNVAIAWVGAVVADLVVNKPLGLSPSYIEFKRAYLYNFNPVGFGSMAIASAVAIAAFVGVFGIYAQAYSPFIALSLAFVLSPAIAFITKGKYYIARKDDRLHICSPDSLIACCICEQKYSIADTAYCPVYDGAICSLCCSLDARCHDICKTSNNPIKNFIEPLKEVILINKISPKIGIRIVKFTQLFLLIAGIIGSIFALVYSLVRWEVTDSVQLNYAQISEILISLYVPLLLLIGIAAWWLVLSEESRELAENELEKQNRLLQQEIFERQQVEVALQKLTHELEIRVAQRTAELSEALRILKQAQTQLVQTEKMSSLGQLIAGVAHEINNPLNFIHGNLEYACGYVEALLKLIEIYQTEIPMATPNINQYIEEIELNYIQEDLPKLLSSMRLGTERIQAIVVSLRNFSRLDEAEVKPVDIHAGIDSTLMILGHRLKAKPECPAIQVIKDYGNLPLIECYAGQMNQVFMNILGNAVDALEEQNLSRSFADIQAKPNQITIRTTVLEGGKYINICIRDNGQGMTSEVKQKVFDYLFTTKPVGKGTGLGLSISYQIVVDKHAGALTCESELGKGTEFTITIPIHQTSKVCSSIPSQMKCLLS